MVKIYRIQDADGRGPWKPGFSSQWIDDAAPVGRLSETVMDLVPMAVLRRLPHGWHYGCGCRSLQALGAWFTQVERERLLGFGYWPVCLTVDAVLKESEWQAFFARRRPLADGATRIVRDFQRITR